MCVVKSQKIALSTDLAARTANYKPGLHLIGLIFKGGTIDHLDEHLCSHITHLRNELIYSGQVQIFRLGDIVETNNGKVVRDTHAQFFSYLKDTQKPANIESIGNWFINYASRFEEENFKTMGKELELYKFRSIDKDKEYWLYLMQMLCAAQAGNEVKAKEAAVKAYKHPFIPAEYKSYLKETYSLTD